MIENNLFDDIRRFLPKYLSQDETRQLFEELKSFPNNLDQRFYSSLLDSENIIFQGDGLKDFEVVDINKKEFIPSPVLIFSNTCDIDLENHRVFSANICYAPIFSLEAYKNKLLETKIKDQKSILAHIEDIKKQRITQILYLPIGANLSQEGIVFLDRLNHCDSTYIKRSEVPKKRIFSLSNYGFYLFLTKLSIHFTRLQENVKRT